MSETTTCENCDIPIYLATEFIAVNTEDGYKWYCNNCNKDGITINRPSATPSLLDKLEQHYWMHQAMEVLYTSREPIVPVINKDEFELTEFHAGGPIDPKDLFPFTLDHAHAMARASLWREKPKSDCNINTIGYCSTHDTLYTECHKPDHHKFGLKNITDTPVINPNTVFPTYPWKRDISMETRKQVSEDIIKNNFPDEEKTDDACDCASNHMFKWYTGTEGDKDNPGNHYIRILCDHSRTEVLRIWGVTRPGKTWTERPNLEDEWFGGTKNTDLSYICPNCNQDRSFKKVPDEGLKCRYCKYIYFPKDDNAKRFIYKNRDRMTDAEVLYWTGEDN